MAFDLADDGTEGVALNEQLNIINELHKAKDEIKTAMHNEIAALKEKNAIQDGKIDRLVHDVEEIDHKISPPEQDGETMRLSIVYDEIKKLRAFKKWIWTTVLGSLASGLYALWSTLTKQ